MSGPERTRSLGLEERPRTGREDLRTRFATIRISHTEFRRSGGLSVRRYPHTVGARPSSFSPQNFESQIYCDSRARCFALGEEAWVGEVACGKFSPSHQVFIDGACGFPTVRDGPDHERLTALTIPRREHAGDAGHEVTQHFDVPAFVEFHSQIFDQTRFFRVHEAHGEQDEIRWYLELTAGDEAKAPVVELHAGTVQVLDLAVTAELHRRHAEVAVPTFF